MKKAITKSWQTTLLGVLGAVSVITTAAYAQLDGDPLTVANWLTVIPTAIGLLGIGALSRDHGVTSKRAGAE